MTPARRVALFVFFFLTGAFGLVYEVVWSRYLAVLVGNTAHAHTVVLGTFMGGLALGAWIFGDLADRVRNGFRAYGLLELVIGAYAVVFDGVFGLALDGVLAASASLEPGSASLTALKFAAAIGCILPPTVLMGGTLPLLTRFLTATAAGLRQAVSRLYAVNSLGAVAGGLLAGFVFIEALGLEVTMTLVGTANALLALGALVLSQRWPQATAEDAPASAAQGTDAQEYGARERRLALVLAGFSGFATMGLEVAWIRYFSLILGSSTYAFTLMLAAFITGIAAGSWWLSTDRGGRVPLVHLLAGALVVTAAYLAFSLAFYDELPWHLARLQRVFRADEAGFGGYQLMVYGACLLLMLPATAVAGLVFPATVRLATEAGRMGGRLGRIYAVNTVGTLAGATVTSLFLFQWIGLENILRALVVAYGLAGALTAWTMLQGPRRARFAGVAGTVVVAHLALHPGLDPLAMNLGLYRPNRKLTGSVDQLLGAFQNTKILDVIEGPHAMVLVREDGESPVLKGAPQRTLTINGKEDASTGRDMPTQLLLAHVPMALHPKPEHAFIVGLGSGTSTGAALTYGGQVDVAEISPEVVAGAAYFAPWNGDPLKNPRCRLYEDDAKSVLQFAQTKYDVIISEPTNPWLAGIAGLFSQDFYAIVEAHLAEGGLFAQWMHTYETDDATVAMVLQTLRATFPFVYVFEPGNADYIFVAGKQPIAFDPAAFRARVQAPAVTADLARMGILDPAVLLAVQVETPASLALSVPDAPLNTDRQPLLEFQAPVKFFAGGQSKLLETADARRTRDPALFWQAYVAAFPLGAEQVGALARFVLQSDAQPEEVGAALRLARQHLGGPHPLTRQLAQRVLVDAPALFQWYEDGPVELSDPVRALETVLAGIALSQAHDWVWAPLDLGRLAQALEGLEARGLPVAEFQTDLALRACEAMDLALCDRLLTQLEPIVTAKHPALKRYAQARFVQAMARRDFKQAQVWLPRWAEVAPQHPGLRAGALQLARALR